MKNQSPKKTKKVVTEKTTVTTRIHYTDEFFEQRQNTDLQIDLKQSALQIEHLGTTLINLNYKLVNQNDLKTDVEEHKNLLAEAQTARDMLHVEIRNLTSEHDRQSAAYRVKQEELNAEVHSLKGVIQEEREEASRVRVVHLNQCEKLNQDHHNTKVAHAALVAKMEADFENMRKSKDAMILSLTQDMEKQRSEYELEAKSLQQTIHTQSTMIAERDTRITSLEAELVVRADCETELAVSRASRNQIFLAKEELQRELNSAIEVINDLEDKLMKASEISIQLLKQLRSLEYDYDAALSEIETLKQYIIDLKSRIAVYIPVRGDMVDKRLAEYINNFPDRQKLKIMFMRESDGIYQFGTKRISVKVEKDKINIRVGGGYLSIDEFLDQYTPVELEKLERKDPLKRFNEKIAVQKTIAGKEVRESSPVRSPRKGSPVKI